MGQVGGTVSVTRDRFLLDCGVNDRAEFDDAARELVFGNFVAFLQAGGVFSWADWASMSDATCELAQRAGQAVKAEELATLARLVGAVLVGEPEPDQEEASIHDGLERAVALEPHMHSASDVTRAEATVSGLNADRVEGAEGPAA